MFFSPDASERKERVAILKNLTAYLNSTEVPEFKYVAQKLQDFSLLLSRSCLRQMTRELSPDPLNVLLTQLLNYSNTAKMSVYISNHAAKIFNYFVSKDVRLNLILKLREREELHTLLLRSDTHQRAASEPLIYTRSTKASRSRVKAVADDREKRCEAPTPETQTMRDLRGRYTQWFKKLSDESRGLVEAEATTARRKTL